MKRKKLNVSETVDVGHDDCTIIMIIIIKGSVGQSFSYIQFEHVTLLDCGRINRDQIYILNLPVFLLLLFLRIYLSCNVPHLTLHSDPNRLTS